MKAQDRYLWKEKMRKIKYQTQKETGHWTNQDILTAAKMVNMLAKKPENFKEKTPIQIFRDILNKMGGNDGS